jgi:DNA-binding response OmpR family regulator
MQSSTDSRTALVFEDDPDLRVLLRRALQEEGYAVHDSERAADVNVLYEAAPPSVAVIDVNLPGRSGFFALHRIRSMDQQNGRRTRVFIISGSVDPILQEEALAGGADAFLIKPFTIQSLRDRVRTN